MSKPLAVYRHVLDKKVVNQRKLKLKLIEIDLIIYPEKVFQTL